MVYSMRIWAMIIIKIKKRENPSSQEVPSAEVTSAIGVTTNVGDKDKKH